MTAPASPRVITGLAELQAAVGEDLGTSDWVTVDQDLINRFAEVTGDNYWGHVDNERSQDTPFGGTIAHGLLTLTLHPRFLYSLVDFRGFSQMFNYGYDKVRFPAPLPTGARVRTRPTITSVEPGSGSIRASIRFVFESDTVEKPICVADYIQYFLL